MKAHLSIYFLEDDSRDMKNYLLKISGAGNRFILADEKWFRKPLPVDWLNHSCKTKKGFESFLELSKMSLSERKSFIDSLIFEEELYLTDGLIVLKKSQKFIFACDFYNRDGSKAEMCGNAACCMSFYAHLMSYPQGRQFQMGEEIVSCSSDGGIVLDKKPVPIADYSYSFNGRKSCFTLIKPGVPHGVIELEASSVFENQAELKKIAQGLRFKNPKDDKGMNVSFFQIEKEERLKAVTYERGVEDFTLACGTGALAVAFVYLSKYQIGNLRTVFVNMPGGRLKIQLEPKLFLFSPVKKGY